MIDDDANQAEQQAREHMSHAEELTAVRFMAGDQRGRRFLRALLSWTRTLAPSPNQYTEGRRSVGLDLVALMDEVDPMLYPSLCADQAREEQSRRLAAERANG